MPDWPRSYSTVQPSMSRKKRVQPLIYLYISFFIYRFLESLDPPSSGVTNRGNDFRPIIIFPGWVFYTQWAAPSIGNRCFVDRCRFHHHPDSQNLGAVRLETALSAAACALTRASKQTNKLDLRGHLLNC